MVTVKSFPFRFISSAKECLIKLICAPESNKRLIRSFPFAARISTDTTGNTALLLLTADATLTEFV